MGNIQLMTATLANQIAAGEVVTRPASCVKELVENALDAGAKAVRVSLREGGIAEIVVQDDGVGMDDEDAVLAFQRHATSKVYDERDLARIRTLGFRGEALASIAAVSRVTLTTRTNQVETGIEVTVEGGEITEKRKVGAPVGTRIAVRDLFFNTPARLKYLRTVHTEQAKSVEVVQQAALSRPDVAFTCETEHQVLFQTPGNGDVRTVLAALYGVGEAKMMLALRGETADYRVSGFIGRPTQGRGTRSYAHLFVNGRPVRNLAIHQAVVQGYKNRLMVGKHPMYAVYLEMDPSLVDVNVHPHKAEVRFSEEADLVRLVAKSVMEAMDDTLLAATPRRTVGEAVHARVQPLELTWQGPEAGKSSGRDEAAATTAWKPRAHVEFQRTSRVDTAHELSSIYGKSDNRGETDSTSLVPPGSAQTDAVQAGLQPEEARKQDWTLRPIGQALGMYVVADDGESLYIIDQHAAHERILYEEFTDRMRRQDVRAMPLLTPIQIALSPSAFEAAMSKQAALEEVGIEFEHFGAYDVVVRTVPDIWEGLDIDLLVHEMFDDVVNPSSSDVLERIQDVIATRACKAAVKANWFLSQPELEALCHALVRCRDPFHCPHGRPIFLRFTDKQLEKEFFRIV
ncbi:DNA mismatch repair endonuclease MutL [Alicyclobacillus acidiphilus]|uniref:DNA mismatch repair endonuclease MutL n=1 Tax=Alicyclobacillus acidiphilus TaxID=182455 RepID=UPI000B127AAE|nr:DNA mismatch repair endonuclease MutL [Alicyclobacillus acidiphilus]